LKAAIFNQAGSPLEIVERDDPVPQEGQVLLKVGRCGICGSDLHMTEHESMSNPAKGFVMGHEIAGEVIAVGKSVSGIKTGDLVAALPITGCGRCAACLSGEPAWCAQGMTFLAGGYAQYALAGARECLKLPAGISLEDGALVEPLAVALHGVRQVPGISGAHVMVMGAGPIGLGAIYWAHRFGAARIDVIEGNPDRAEMARKLGATSVTAPDLSANPLAVMPDRSGPEFVFECVGRPGLFAAAVAAVRPKGTVVSLGFCVAPEQVLAAAAGMREVTVKFPMLYTLQDFQTTIDCFEAGHVEPRLMVTGRTGLDTLPTVFESLRQPGSQCKVMVDPWADAA
jgi:threonine dehydrogenase-like Zn-dependent dehydrogenase